MINRQPGRPMKARPRILETASVLFLQQGLDISLDEIANEAGTTRQTLYNHFPSKDALVLETFNHLIEKMQPPIATILTQESVDLPQVLARFASVVQAHFSALRTCIFSGCWCNCCCRNLSCTPRCANAMPGECFRR